MGFEVILLVVRRFEAHSLFLRNNLKKCANVISFKGEEYYFGLVEVKKRKPNSFLIHLRDRSCAHRSLRVLLTGESKHECVGF